MKKNKKKLSELREGPIRDFILPTGFITRVQKYKERLEEVERSSIEETLNAFQRDQDPERELEIWETIAEIYTLEVEKKPYISLEQKKDMFKTLLLETVE